MKIIEVYFFYTKLFYINNIFKYFCFIPPLMEALILSLKTKMLI